MTAAGHDNLYLLRNLCGCFRDDQPQGLHLFMVYLNLTLFFFKLLAAVREATAGRQSASANNWSGKQTQRGLQQRLLRSLAPRHELHNLLLVLLLFRAHDFLPQSLQLF